MHKTLLSRVIGFLSSLLLTMTAFLIIFSPESLHLNVQMASIAILTLAILQAIIQSICFLNVLSEKGIRWNLIIFTSTISIIIVIIVGSIWIMNHLNYNMMFSDNSIFWRSQ